MNAPRPVILAAAVVLLTAGGAVAEAPSFAPLPEPPKVDEAKARIGNMLFFDTRLSGDTASSCASCHSPEAGWGDGQALSDGYTGTAYFRNAPSLFNVAHRKYLMWDGRLDGSDLGTVVRDMLTEAHTMNMDSRLAQERLKQVPEYAEAFKAAYGGDPYGGQIYGAIGEYLKTIRTTNAPFDRYLRGEDAALTAEQATGMELFQGKANCIACHSGPTLSDGGLHALGVPENAENATDAERQITMLRHFATMGTPNYMNLREDVGNYVVSKDRVDIGKFVTPSLWDVGQTAPYMHSGTVATLADVVDFYDAGGGEAANKSPLIQPLNLSAEEKSALVAFLESLTGDAPDTTVPELPEYAPRELGKN
ncbi:cytochrome-c peroxidase [Caenispirillum salinarum]|uniref:cytochrome-c peroxidase n=1 Tax=Caenispirillum salinarum TaxID=859058 RepID=UPI0038516685